MIVKMYKVILLLSAKQREAALEKLRSLGVLHIQYVQNPQHEDIDALQTEAAHIERALQIIGDEKSAQKNVGKEKISTVVEKILTLAETRKRLTGELEECLETYRWFQKWGVISYASVQSLKEVGVFVRFYVADKSALTRLVADKPIHIAREDKHSICFAYFAESTEDRLDLKEERIPEVEVASLEANIEHIQKEMKKVDQELKKSRGVGDSLMAYRDGLKKRIEFNEVKYSMGEEDRFGYLQGFCPLESAVRIKKTADREGWAYIIQEPDNPGEVPTLIRKPKWLRIIDPLFKFMGTVPGYDEYDISFWFLFFFSLFFGILIGDAGYGLVFLGLTLFASKKAGKKVPKEPFRLVTVLSVATLIWGLITGNWFGFERIARIPFLDRFVIDQIDGFASDNSMFMMHLCFVIGIVHLSIAHGIRAFRIINSPRALGELGWICILWTLFFVAGSLVIGEPMPSFWSYLFVAGIVLALVFSNFQKNVLKGMGQTLGDMPLSIISSFSDVVSYLRLFAVGSASVTVASSFNNMAIGGGIHSIVGGLIAALILFLGHSLNIMLGMMSVIVHGVRLNMLEFSGHLDMQWAGKKYQPFKE